MPTDERWQPVQGFEDFYEISSWGQVKSLDRTHQWKGYGRTIQGGIKTLEEHVCGYLRVYLYQNGKRSRHFVHRLVARAFLPNPDHKPIVNHKDRNRKNNAVTNLEWTTESENMLHWREDEHAREQLLASMQYIPEAIESCDLPF